MVAAIIALLEIGLKLWSDINKTKYLDRLMNIKKNLYEEMNKPMDQRDDAVIDNLTFDLKLLTDSFISAIGISASGKDA